MQLYSPENVAETLAKQAEVLTEGRVITELVLKLLNSYPHMKENNSTFESNEM